MNNNLLLARGLKHRQESAVLAPYCAAYEALRGKRRSMCPRFVDLTALAVFHFFLVAGRMSWRSPLVLPQQHHEERLHWIQGIHSVNTRIRPLLEAHTQSTVRIEGQLQYLNDRMIIHPNHSKTQGFAVVLWPREPGNEQELQFIAGQHQHVIKQTRDPASSRSSFHSRAWRAAST